MCGGTLSIMLTMPHRSAPSPGGCADSSNVPHRGRAAARIAREGPAPHQLAITTAARGVIGGVEFWAVNAPG